MRINNSQPGQAVKGESSPNTSASKSRHWSQDQRLDFIDFRLYWDGRINRRDLCTHFGISIPQASLDLAEYLKLAPDKAAYDRREKVYLATENFTPSRISPNSYRYLNDLHAIAQGSLEREATFLGWIPETDVAPKPHRDIPVPALRIVLHAIRNKRKLRIRYQSLSHDDPSEREIEPHFLANDGFRWHVRAYCNKRKTFSDFVFARILNLEEVGESTSDPSLDSDWNTMVDVIIGPHPGLKTSQFRTIELDYGMVNGSAKITTRRALLFYTLKQLGLLPDQMGESEKPNVQQIVLLNKDDVHAHLNNRGQ